MIDEWAQLRLDGGVDVVTTAGPAVGVTAERAIGELRAAGHSWVGVARHLNAAGVPTPSGRGRWHDQTARHHFERAAWARYMRDYRHGRSS